jgi:diguanylate cyclase (GGDEF)-like protein
VDRSAGSDANFQRQLQRLLALLEAQTRVAAALEPEEVARVARAALAEALGCAVDVSVSTRGAVKLRARGRLDAELQRALELFADGASVALRNAHLYQQARRESRTDPLTGLLNRRAFDAQLELEVQRARRLGYPVGLLMIDVDEFKDVNDRHGHPAGDETLRQLSGLFSGRLRRSDVVARLGGEEFAIVLPGAVVGQVVTVAEKLRTAVGELSMPRVTISVGGASLAAARASAATLLDQADRALYAAKRHGRNQVRVWDDPMTR